MLRIYTTAAAYAILSFFGLTLAVAASGEVDFGALAKPLYESIAQGNYAAAAAFGLVLLVAVVRRYGGSRYPILSHKLVAPAIVLLGSLGAALASAFVSGAGVSLATLYAALKVAAYASGGYAVAKVYLDALGAKSPKWAKPFIAILSAILSAKGNAKKAAVKKAEKAGDNAVKDSPAQGIDIDFTDVE